MNRLQPTYLPEAESSPPAAPPTVRDEAVTWVSLIFLVALMIYLCFRSA